jgi:hypothetical protein
MQSLEANCGIELPDLTGKLELRKSSVNPPVEANHA